MCEFFMYGVVGIEKLIKLNSGYSLESFDPGDLDELDCHLAVFNNPTDVQFVPKKFQSQRLFLFAVCLDWSAMKFVPKEFLTEDFVLTAIERHEGEDYCLNWVPPELKTERVIRSLLSKGWNRTDKLLLSAAPSNR